MNKKTLTYKICPSCNYFCSIEEDNNFCPFCGETLMSECQSCKKVIETPYASFCSKCGTAFPGRNKNNKN